MDELIYSGELTAQAVDSPFSVATIAKVTNQGASLYLNGSSVPTQKYYMHVGSENNFTVGDRVLITKVTGTYVILGKITA